MLSERRVVGFISRARFSLVGLFFLLLSFSIAFFVFGPAIKEEVRYFFFRPDENARVTFNPGDGMKPVDPYFSITIPKIGANARVITNVDPTNEREYQWQLTKGVAHAQGTENPGEGGNVFLFAHSAGNILQANRYNAIFYLLNKLKYDDMVYITYYNKIYNYRVKEVKIVNAKEVQYLQPSIHQNKETVTLMTCWPSGTSFQRLIVIAEKV